MSRKWLFIIGGLVGVSVCVCTVVGLSIAVMGRSTDTTAQNNHAQLYQLNQNVIVGKVRWKVLAAEDLGQELKSDNSFRDPITTPGRFIRVRVEVENRDTDARTFAEGDIVDSQGRTFNDHSDGIFFVADDERCILESLNPNLPRVCTNIYEVPANAAGLKLVVGDLAPFGDEASISLDLP